MSDFVILYPGVYTKKEKKLVEKYMADNKALTERGEIDVGGQVLLPDPLQEPLVGRMGVVGEQGSARTRGDVELRGRITVVHDDQDPTIQVPLDRLNKQRGLKCPR